MSPRRARLRALAAPLGAAPRADRLWRLAALAATAFATAMLTWIGLGGRGLDLAPLYVAGRLAAEGAEAHLYVYQPLLSPEVHDPEWSAAAAAGGYRDWLLAFVFAPIWAEIAAFPAAHLPWRLFHTGFAIANAGALAAGAWVAARLWAPEGRGVQVAAISLVALPFAWPAAASAWFNQVQPWATLALLLALREAERDRPARAGMLLALAAALKLSPAAMGVWWLIAGRWRAAGWALGAGAALFAVNLVIGGVEETRAFLDQLGRIGTLLQSGGMNQSLLNPVSKLFGAQMPEGIGVVPVPPGALPLTWALVLAALAVAAIRLLPRGTEARRGRLMPAALILVTVAAPLAWTHYFPFLVPLAVALGFRLRFGAWIAGAAILALITATAAFRLAPGLHLAWSLSPLAVALGLALAAVVAPERGARPGPRPAPRPAAGSGAT